MVFYSDSSADKIVNLFGVSEYGKLYQKWNTKGLELEILATLSFFKF